MELLDISRRLDETTAVWPGDRPFRLEWTERIGPSVPGSANVSAIQLSCHAGTHLDAPLHVLESGQPIDAIDLAVFVGPCRVLDLSGQTGPVDPLELGPLGPAGPPRVLLRTSAAGASRGLSASAAERLVQTGARLVGMDGPSVDPPGSGDLAAHRILAASGVVGLENLDLSRVAAGEYWLIALPLSLAGAEGSPVRAVLVRDSSPGR